MKAALADWFKYEIYLAGTPEQNPRRRPYWTAPYIDAGGTGAMVSHGSPVYVEDRFLGVVGTDVRLATLEDFLNGLPVDVGRLMILNDRHILLADTAGIPEDAIRNVVDVLPGVITGDRLTRAVHAAGETLEAERHVLVARNTTHAPWTLVYLVSDEEITGLLLPRLLPYAVILVALAATVFIALYLLRREYISPALALVRYIRDASRNPSITGPQLPRLWQTWVGVVSRALTDNRDATRRIQESEGRLHQILNNSSAVVYVRDRDDRFLLVNRPFERLLGISQSEIVGKQLEEVFPPETAAEFRANDRRVLDTNAVMEFEEEVTLKDGVHTYISSKFPLFDTDGEIYAICGISTDITKRKQTEEILRQAALGISEAQGEQVFNSLVMHLSKAIGTDYAFIGVLENKEYINTRALCAHGRIEDNITYCLEGSPCQNVVGRQFRFYPNRIQERFPTDTLLQEIGVESYAAIPLFDSKGGVLGLLAVLHSQPLKDQAQVESILQIFAGRAASELERERADDALRASEASYRAIFEASEDAIFVHDLGTVRILDINQKACEIYGYAYEELLQMTVGDLSSGVPPYTQEDAMQLIARAVAGERLNFEWHRRNRDGSLHWDEVFARRVPIGGRDRILVHTREITARKEAEEKLRASEEQYRSIFNAASDALILWDAQGNMVDVNPAAWKMGGYTRDEFLREPFDEHIHPSSRASYEKFIHDVATVKAAFTETRAIRKDGTIIDLESRSIPMPYQGNPHILTITRDITEQKRSAEELSRQREALRQSEKLSAMGELLAGVAHELNNPLAILMGRAALLESKTSDPAVRTEVGKISAAAERCGRIVRTFLSMARQKPPECKPASLNDVVTSAIDLLGYGLHTSGIELETRLAEVLPEPSMDADQIGQIVINLLVNAQHVLAEQPQPRRIVLETGQSKGGVYCRVFDNGPGVPKELQQRVFDPFFTTKDSGIGTGVGLSVSRSIAREHSGELRLESNKQGAAFVLWIPLDTACTRAEPVKSPDTADELHPDHVLVVDDEPEVAELLAEILQSAGLETTLVHSGQEALKWLEAHSCDLILSDIRMPDMDGPALWRALKERHPDLVNRTAFITGDTLSASIAPFLRETGLPWLEKPFTPEQLLALVARIEVD
ncbi:MAG: PAS domain S-box protein [Gammaproteobacteria bacterium]